MFENINGVLLLDDNLWFRIRLCKGQQIAAQHYSHGVHRSVLMNLDSTQKHERWHSQNDELVARPLP